MRLHQETWGRSGDHTLPLVLLHGFGGAAAIWRPLAAEIAAETPVIAFDLPGHGGSIHVPAGGAGSMAKAVAADLKGQAVRRFHLAGHSMGGAVAALLALRQPERVASLALLAPGGFGSEINGAVLRRYAFAEDAGELAEALRAMCAPMHPLDETHVEALLEVRRLPGARETLARILDIILTDPEGRAQGVLPVSELSGLPMPVQVLWGSGDPILPIGQTEGLPENVLIRRLADAGHMLVEERPDEVLEALRGVIARGG